MEDHLNELLYADQDDAISSIGIRQCLVDHIAQQDRRGGSCTAVVARIDAGLLQYQRRDRPSAALARIIPVLELQRLVLRTLPSTPQKKIFHLAECLSGTGKSIFVAHIC